MLANAVLTTIAECGYRAVGRFSTDDLDEALAMTTHGGLWPAGGWHVRPEPARYRFPSPCGRTKEAASEAGSLFVRAGRGYVLADPRPGDPSEAPRFLQVGAVDAEAVRMSYPWP